MCYYNGFITKINKRFKDGRCTYKNTGSSHLKHFESAALWNNKIFLMLPAFVLSFLDKDSAYSLLMLCNGTQSTD